MTAFSRLALVIALAVTTTGTALASSPTSTFGLLPASITTMENQVSRSSAHLKLAQVDARELAECRGAGSLRQERDCFLILRSIELD